MRTWRWSWWRRRRWWVAALEPVAVMALLVAAVAVARAVVPGAAPSSGGWLGAAAGSTLGSAFGSLRDRSRRAARWDELQAAALASDEQMDAAERIVRQGLVPVDEQTRALAVRVARTQQELAHYGLSAVLGALITAGCLVAGVLASPFWLAWTALGGLLSMATAIDWRRLRRRRRQLESMATDPGPTAHR